MNSKKNRAGIFIQQPEGYKTFKPCKLLSQIEIKYDDEMMRLLSEADRKIGRLDGITQIIPNPGLFLVMYIKKEAILSSQIEGTQASLSDVLELEEKVKRNAEITDVFNYIKAIDEGLEELKKLPISLRLIRNIHRKLLSSGRGSSKKPGEFRTDQNWIGPKGCSIKEASFIPPTVSDMKESLYDLEEFLHYSNDMPTLVKIAIIHSQFETIHPFVDGNGRIGRLLITFLLCQNNILEKPLLYLSYYFKKYRLEYYDQLMNVRQNGDWESWIKFFLKGVADVSDQATQTGKDILKLKNKCEEKIRESNNAYAKRLLEHLFTVPFITKNKVKEFLNTSYPTASKTVELFCEYGILKDNTPNQQRNKQYKFTEYMIILDKGTEL